MKKSSAWTFLVIALGLLGLATGCSTPEKTAANKAEDEYVYVTVTGSNIPKKIKKSDIASGNIPADVQAQLMDKESFAKGLRPGTSKSN